MRLGLCLAVQDCCSPPLESTDISLFCPTPQSNCTRWCLSTISNSVIPCKVRYLCLHWKSNFTPIKSCNNRIYNPILQTSSILPAALTMWYNEVSRKLSMMIIMALSIFFFFKGWSNEMGWNNLKKSATHDGGGSFLPGKIKLFGRRVSGD